MPLTGAPTSLGIPNFGPNDSPALDRSPGMLDITAAINALFLGDEAAIAAANALILAHGARHSLGGADPIASVLGLASLSADVIALSSLGIVNGFGSTSFAIATVGAAPATKFRHLELTGNARSTRAGFTTDTIGLRFNLDALIHYNSLESFNNEGATNVVSSPDRADDHIVIGSVPAALETSGSFGAFKITIFDFQCLSAGMVPVLSKCGLLYAGASPGMAHYDTFGLWNQFVAVTRIDVFSLSGSGLVGQMHVNGIY